MIISEWNWNLYCAWCSQFFPFRTDLGWWCPATNACSCADEHRWFKSKLTNIPETPQKITKDHRRCWVCVSTSLGWKPSGRRWVGNSEEKISEEHGLGVSPSQGAPADLIRLSRLSWGSSWSSVHCFCSRFWWSGIGRLPRRGGHLEGGSCDKIPDDCRTSPGSGQRFDVFGCNYLVYLMHLILKEMNWIPDTWFVPM